MIAPTVPLHFRSERLRYRPWESSDAPALLRILEANREHLLGWIPRHVAEPVPIPELGARLNGFGAAFESDREWRYAILSLDERELLGEVSLFPRDSRDRVAYSKADRAEIGYWLGADATGRGIATEAARAVLDIACALPRIRHVEIRCDARNTRSAAIPRRLGFQLATPLDKVDMVWVYGVSQTDESEPARA